MGDIFRAMKEDKKERSKKNYDSNMPILDGCEFKHEIRNQGSVYLFRHPGKPKVDYYPTKNSWRIVGSKPRKMNGTANDFLNWYRRQDG